MSTDEFVPSFTVAALAWTSASVQLTLLAVGLAVPVGYTSRYDGSGSADHRDIERHGQRASRHRGGERQGGIRIGTERVDWARASRVSSTLVGSIDTNAVGAVSAAEAIHMPPPPNETATAAPIGCPSRTNQTGLHVDPFREWAKGAPRRAIPLAQRESTTLTIRKSVVNKVKETGVSRASVTEITSPIRITTPVERSISSAAVASPMTTR